VAGGEQAAYDAAFSALKGADYQRAISGFRNFVATYPGSALASNAQYWLGEAYYVNKEYQNAIAAFQKVTTDWPDSRKAPDALVKIGFTQSAMGRNGDARVTLEDVVRRYPGTEAAQLATERLKRLPANAK
jgi:tol-pal system protein YbgF